MMNHARYIPSWVDSGATFIWINDVLQGKSAHKRVFWLTSELTFTKENRRFFTLLTSTELWVLQKIDFLHKYSSFLSADHPYQ